MAQQRTSQNVLPPGAEAVGAIPDKLYFRIGEAAALCGVPAYVLRFWESEFPQLKPNKGGTGQRLFRRRDVEMARRIRALLYEGKFTIPGARQVLKTEQRQREPQMSLSIVENDGPRAVDRKALRRLRKEMQDIVELLSSPVPSRGGSVQPIRAVRVPKPVRIETPGSEDLFS